MGRTFFSHTVPVSFRRAKILAVVAMCFASCQRAETVDFLAGERQVVASRDLQGDLVPVDSFSVNVAAGYVPPQWAVTGDTVIIYEASEGHVRMITSAFGAQHTDTLHLPANENGGASNRAFDIEVRNGRLYVMDGSSGGVSVYSLSQKEHLMSLSWGEMEVKRFCVVNDSTVAVLNNRSGSPVLALAAKEGVVKTIGQAAAGEDGYYNRLRTQGWLACDAGNIYWVGYSEPLLARYEVSGARGFTKSTVDFFETSGNYAFYPERQGENFWLSPGAIFASSSISIRGDELWVLVHPNGEDRFSLIDVYEASTGLYKRTYRVPMGILSSLHSVNGVVYTLRDEVEAGRVVIYRFDLL